MKIISLIKATLLGATLMIASNAYAGDWKTFECGAGWAPTRSAAPTYPRRAIERGIEGYIIMTFSITTDGTVEDIAVKEAKPLRSFVRTATRAVSAMEFPPCRLEGLAIKLTDVSIKYDFNLEG